MVFVTRGPTTGKFVWDGVQWTGGTGFDWRVQLDPGERIVEGWVM